MANDGRFTGTSIWLSGQWSNPTDIFTILLILGGDVVHVAIAQLCAGPWTSLTLVTFSFGWVSYSVSAALSAVGENSLMPKPDFPCIIINAQSGYARANQSWILSRILRDFDHWKDPVCDKVEDQRLKELLAENKSKAVEEQKDEEDVRIALRVSVWDSVHASGKPSHDWVYWIGLPVAAAQLGVAAIPLRLYGEWLILMITSVGTLLALVSCALPQWQEEKYGVRKTKDSDGKDVFLTTGNGAHDVVLIRGCANGMDLEALASPQRMLRWQSFTRAMVLLLAIAWISLLISIAGYAQHTWYLLGVGMIGMFHNILVAGMPRNPKAFGIDLQYNTTFVDSKVMEVLWTLEESFPSAGAALLPTFFPGKLIPREKLLWEYADRRKDAYNKGMKAYKKAQRNNRDTTAPKPWVTPSLSRPENAEDDKDIPSMSEYVPQET